MSRSRRILLAFLGFAFLVALVQSLGRPAISTGSLDLRLATTNAGPRGARAAYLWLREMGFPARSYRRPYTSLDASVQALAVLDPSQAITERQGDALFDWLTEGGTLLVAPGGNPELRTRLAEWVSFEVDELAASEVPGDRIVLDDAEHAGHRRWRYREATPDERGMFPYPVRDIAFRWDSRVIDPAGEHRVLFARDGLGLVAEFYAGDGAVVVFADEEMLSNRGIEKAQNVELFASLMEDWVEPGTEIWFDDYHHGERAGGSLAAYLARRRPGLFAAALLLAGALAVMRFGRALVVGADRARFRRRRPAEFVEALGLLYERSRAVSPAWRALEQISRRMLDGSSVARLRTTRRDWPQRAERLERALRPSRPPDERELVKLARALAAALDATPRAARTETTERRAAR